jgi:hypothetical protein
MTIYIKCLSSESFYYVITNNKSIRLKELGVNFIDNTNVWWERAPVYEISRDQRWYTNFVESNRSDIIVLDSWIAHLPLGLLFSIFQQYSE